MYIGDRSSSPPSTVQKITFSHMQWRLGDAVVNSSHKAMLDSSTCAHCSSWKTQSRHSSAPYPDHTAYLVKAPFFSRLPLYE